MPRRPPAPMHMRGLALLVLVAVAVTAYAVPAAYADHPTAEVTNAPGSSVPGCEETNECFIPADVTVDVGGEVTWTNDDTAAHTITAGTVEDGPTGPFDSGLVITGSAFTFKFEEAGTYPYYCIVHPWMAGTVTVSGDSHDDDSDKAMDDDGGMAMDDDSDKAMDDDGGMAMDDDSDKAMDDDHGSMEMAMAGDGDTSATGMLPDGTPVELTATRFDAQRVMQLDIVFKDSKHVNYDIVAVQDGETVLDVKDAHEHGGMGTHRTMPMDLDPDEFPLEVTVTFNGYGVNEMTGETGDVVFANIVPEFGTIAVLILAVAVVSIVAVTARSRQSLVPRI